MWKCKIDLSTIYKVITVICNNKFVYDMVCTYYSQLLLDNSSSDNDDITINIYTYETYSLFKCSELMSFETDKGNELESLLHLIEELIFQKDGYNNIYVPLHASAVVDKSGKATLLVGGTYSGKSTLLLYLIMQGYDFYADDLILVDRENTKLKFFPRPLHIREKTMSMFSDFFDENDIKAYKLSNNSYFVKLPHNMSEPTIRSIIKVKYDEKENSFITRTGFEKVLNITKNMKGTKISNWQQNTYTFSNVQYFELKYNDFSFVNQKILKGRDTTV